MSISARVLILAEDDRWAGDLAEQLDLAGWRTVTARDLSGALLAVGDMPIEVAILDASSPSDAYTAAARLKAAVRPRRLPVMALGAPHALSRSDAFDLVLSPPLHPSQAAHRVESLARAAVAEEEYALRAETFAERGRPLAAPDVDGSPLRVLTVGEPAPKFLALSHQLKAEGADVTGAFTPYTAFDYLHERRFDAVVLWAGETHAEALSIAGGMRRNTRLYHLPTLLFAREGAELDPGLAFDRGLSDLAGPETSPEEAARRALSLARAYRREQAIRAALETARGSGLLDAATGLFTRDLFAAHFGRMANAARARRRRLSVAVLRIAERPHVAALRRAGWLDRAIPQIGSMIGRLVRVEDVAARLAPDLFALALPAATHASAKAAAERIAAVIACTAFEAGEGATPFTVDFDLGAAELQPGESAARTLERAAAAVLTRRAG